MRSMALASVCLATLILTIFYVKSTLDAAEIRTDLERVCKVQHSFLETRKLMKHVSERELATERSQRFQQEIKSSLVKQALADASRAPKGSRRKSLDKLALNAGLRSWNCAELDQL